MSAPSNTYSMSPEHRQVFLGLMIGMLVASISQTIVGPGMPRIVADLGGMDYYSWVATAAMLVSAIIVPIVGKLSDLYGRRGFYLAGLAVFMLGALVSGLSVNFWMLVVGRTIQGLGMGTIMPLSQTIIGDIIPARQRGKYQGYMGAVFGLTSVAGPLAGGFITDAWGWRWLFFSSVPLVLIAWFVIARFLKLPHERREAKVDTWGIVTLIPALTLLLLAISWGGSTFPWSSPVTITLFVVGGIFLVLFILAERRAEEPILPLRLFRNSIFTTSNIAAFALSMVMFGTIIYIPVYAQGVLGVSATESGLILLPLMLGMVVIGIVTGLLITRIGRYKEFMLTGVGLMAVGQYLLTRLTADSSLLQLSVAMAVFGVGLGMALQQYTLVVQNAVSRRDLGVGTASTQFFRNVGATIGTSLFGSIMVGGLSGAIASHLPAGMLDDLEGTLGHIDAGVAMNPDAIPGLPAEVVEAVRLGLADQLHWVFIATFPMLAVAFVATLLIKYIPLQETVSSVEDARRELLDTMSQSSGRDEVVPGLGSQDEGARTRERIMALNLALLLEQSDRPNRVLLRQAVEDLGKGNLASGQSILARTVEMLSTDDPQRQAATEKFAVLLDQAAAQKGGVLSDEVRKEIAVRVAANKPREEVLSTFESTVADNVSSVNIRRLRYATNDLTTALLMDLDRPGAVHTDPTDGLPSDAIRAEERHPGETSGTVTVEIPKEDS